MVDPSQVPRHISASAGELLTRARAHDIRALSRLLTMAEAQGPSTRELSGLLAGYPNNQTYVLGITGSPGSGKSTITSALVSAYRARGLRVAVLAVDPSSPYTGGALLGDRTRMLKHTADDGVFIRSMAARGRLGGLAGAAFAAILILGAAGFDVLIVETVGVGQSETEVVEVSDTTLVVMTPGAGDGIQAVKAGIVEIADILVVNKADRSDADLTVRELRDAVRLSRLARSTWQRPVVRSVALDVDGVADILRAIDEHRAWLAGGARYQKRREQIRTQVARLAVAEFQRCLRIPDSLVTEIENGRMDVWTASRSVVGAWTKDAANASIHHSISDIVSE